MWLQKKFTDLVVSAWVDVTGLGDDGGPEVHCHRAVLAANSVESSEGRIVLRGVSAKAARAFLEFLYTGQPGTSCSEDCSTEYLADLMYLAEQCRGESKRSRGCGMAVTVNVSR
eukprot:Skav236613  [mRNA]  locus=scaffold1476:102851:107831:- [translate_table: standard]